jgi:quinone-modifying oxidoreductase, subunit QmoB
MDKKNLENMNSNEEYKKIPLVLVWGKGLTARETASQLQELGYEVIPVNPEDGIQVLGIEGFAGDFQVTFRNKDSFFPPFEKGGLGGIFNKVWAEQVGAIVFSPELIHEESNPALPINSSSRIISLEELAALLPPDLHKTPEHISLLDEEGRGRREEIGSRLRMLKPDSYVAFWVGVDTIGHVSDMAVVLSDALEIRKQTQAQIFIFCRQVKVAGEGLERLYQACRDEGILFFKFEKEGLALNRVGDDIVIQFEDAVLKMPFTLTPDLLIVDSRHSLPAEVQMAALLAGVGMDQSGFLQPANVHLWPQASLREGIFIAGPGKGPMLPETCREEAGSVALAVHHFFNGRISGVMSHEVTVDKGLCTLCLTCLRFCPHQAIGWTHRVFIHPLACRRCGICAGECPMDAIQISGFSDGEIETKLEGIRKTWDETGAREPRIVLLGCQRSAGVVWEEIQNSKFKLQSDVAFIGLPCAGKLDPDHILKAFVSGAEGVLVLACPEENCRSIHGNVYAQDRVREIQTYLEEAGVSPNRIRFEHVSSNMEWYLKEIVRQFSDELTGFLIPQSAFRNPKL